MNVLSPMEVGLTQEAGPSLTVLRLREGHAAWHSAAEAPPCGLKVPAWGTGHPRAGYTMGRWPPLSWADEV